MGISRMSESARAVCAIYKNCDSLPSDLTAALDDLSEALNAPSLAESLEAKGFKPPPEREDIALKIGESK